MKQESSWQSYLTRVALEKEPGILPGLIRYGLGILELVYLVLLKVNSLTKIRRSLPVPVISVGNITVGGTGKTPTVVWLVKQLNALGYQPAILTRGYGGKAQKYGLIFNHADLEHLSAEETGDEPYLLAGLLPGTPIVVGRERYKMALRALQEKPEINLFVLDDGFQHWEVGRDLDLVLLDAVKPFSNQHLLPRGLLREPLDSLKRAGILFLTRCAKLTDLERHQLIQQIRFWNSAIPIAFVHEENRYLVPLNKTQVAVNRIPAGEFLQGRRVGAITAIGNPRQFLASLENLGAEVGYFKAYPDHYQWEATELYDMIKGLHDSGFHELIVTAKDGVKLQPLVSCFTQLEMECYILALDFQVTDEAVIEKIKHVVKAGKKQGAKDQQRKL